MSVQIGEINAMLGSYLSSKKYSKMVIIMDKNTNKYCWPILKIEGPQKIIIEQGEKHKNLETCTAIWQAMTNYELDRHAIVINLGGGVVGDMGGFCASTYKRGIDFIQIPTTLLSQVDASLGGKLGIDFNGFKNHIGVFTLPKTVLIDPVFLKTLKENELRSGFAEVIKHCLIRDKDMWEVIRQLDLGEQDFERLIKHSVEIKKQVVESDFTEQGPRKILNFGHTIGHAVETHFLENKPSKLLHGEAIAAGMIMESYLGLKKGMLSQDEFFQIEEFLFSVYGVISIEPSDQEMILKYCYQDKKNKGKKVLASILKGIGDCTYDVELSPADIKMALKYYIGA